MNRSINITQPNTMPHLTTMNWDYLDQLHSASNGTFTSYYNYDNERNRTRKVVVKGNIREERYYVNGHEIFRKYTNDVLDFERKTINISYDEKVFVRVEQKTGENPAVRYQYDNHLGSACLELYELGAIISYEEYHPFGTTSYRSGRSETEVSLKLYKYCGKEWDEETGLYYYGARYYAAWLGRFVSVDPLNEKYPELSAYQYASNRPIIAIDLDGLEALILNNDDNTITFTANIYFVTAGEGNVNPTDLKLRSDELLVNKLSEEQRTVNNMTIHFELNYITTDECGNSLTYEKAIEMATNSKITHTTSKGEIITIEGPETGVVVKADKLLDKKGEYIEKIINSEGNFNLIKLQSSLTNLMDQNKASLAFVHELGHFLGRKSPDKADHPGGFGGTNPGITSNEDKNIRLVPDDLVKMLQGAIYYGKFVIIKTEQ